MPIPIVLGSIERKIGHHGAVTPARAYSDCTPDAVYAVTSRIATAEWAQARGRIGPEERRRMTPAWSGLAEVIEECLDITVALIDVVPDV
jgi:hypothetical protein